MGLPVPLVKFTLGDRKWLGLIGYLKLLLSSYRINYRCWDEKNTIGNSVYLTPRWGMSFGILQRRWTHKNQQMVVNVWRCVHSIRHMRDVYRQTDRQIEMPNKDLASACWRAIETRLFHRFHGSIPSPPDHAHFTPSTPSPWTARKVCLVPNVWSHLSLYVCIFVTVRRITKSLRAGSTPITFC